MKQAQETNTVKHTNPKNSYQQLLNKTLMVLFPHYMPSLLECNLQSDKILICFC
jgi:hypothetical protein